MEIVRDMESRRGFRVLSQSLVIFDVTELKAFLREWGRWVWGGEVISD